MTLTEHVEHSAAFNLLPRQNLGANLAAQNKTEIIILNEKGREASMENVYARAYGLFLFA